MSTVLPETARHLTWPSIRQFSVFLPNRVGGLLQLIRALEDEDVHVVALNVVNSIDCSIVRLVVDKPQIAQRVFSDHHYPVNECDLVAVELPDEHQPLIAVCRALLSAELNIYNVYGLLPHFHGRPAVALQVDDTRAAIQVLHNAGYRVISETDMGDPDRPRFEQN